jgi:hypothetical protein
MCWNFDDDSIRVPRSILLAATVEATKDLAAEWPRVQVVLMRVLSLFPEARDAFVKAIQEAFTSKREPIPQWAT